MPELQLDNILLLVVVSVFTAAAATTDWRTRKIPNKLTIPVFFAGLVYQLVFHQLAGLQDAGLGFLVGFGTLFVLWLVGSGGGGDVKLMGALSVWLGFKMTFAVLIVSTFFVMIGTLYALTASMLKQGIFKTKEKYLPGAAKKAHPSHDRKNRRIMAYALPVAIATWLVMFWMVPKWPHRNQEPKSGDTTAVVETPES